MNNNDAKFDPVQMEKIANIIQTTCYQNFIKFHNKILKYMFSEFDNEYDIKNIMYVIIQFYKEHDENIQIIQDTLNNDTDTISTFLTYLSGMILLEMNQKYKK